MNARAEWQDQQGAAGPNAEEIRGAMRRVTDSPAFAKAPRMCALLSFLIEKKLGGEEGGLNEYAIGTQLFRRDAASYDTTIDPIVRVQIGRLRTRLAGYYSSIEKPAALQICIPAGSYVPTLRRVAPNASTRADQRLELAPLRCLSLDERNSAFAGGLDEELSARMFTRFPGLAQVCERHASDIDCFASGDSVKLRLEGSIRVEQAHVRASMRLLDNSLGQTVWTAQFDCSGMLGIALQEQLANAICVKLADHFAVRQPS